MAEQSVGERWLKAYVRAWRDDSPENILELFEPEARYFTAPGREPHVGQDAIIEWWRSQGEASLPWTFEGGVIASDGELHVIQGVTTYPKGGDGQSEQVVYDNLWLVQLTESGRATQFVEYWMKQE